MSDTRTTDDLTRLAPDVDRAWLDGFVVEQRLLGVPGDQIGDALAVVQSHLADTGETVEEAFGPALDYARAVAPSQRADDGGRGWMVGTGLGLVGMLATTVGARSWLSGDGSLEVTVGLATIVGVALVAYLLLSRRPAPVLRWLLKHVWLTTAANVVGTALLVVLALQLRATLVELPAAVVTATGVALLLASTSLAWRAHAAGRLEDPLTGPSEVAPTRSAGVGAWLTVLLFTLLTAVMVALSQLLELLA